MAYEILPPVPPPGERIPPGMAAIAQDIRNKTQPTPTERAWLLEYEEKHPGRKKTTRRWQMEESSEDLEDSRQPLPAASSLPPPTPPPPQLPPGTMFPNNGYYGPPPPQNPAFPPSYPPRPPIDPYDRAEAMLKICLQASQQEREATSKEWEKIVSQWERLHNAELRHNEALVQRVEKEETKRIEGMNALSEAIIAIGHKEAAIVKQAAEKNDSEDGALEKMGLEIAKDFIKEKLRAAAPPVEKKVAVPEVPTPT